MATMIQLKSTSADAFEFGALHAQAEGKHRGGIIVLQEIFGIDEYVEADVQRWAKLGFEVLAPSLFDRLQKGFTAAHDEAGFKAAFAMMDKARPDDALADIAACLAFLKPRGPVFITGYCYGGTLAWKAASQLDGLAAAASYYGSGVAAAAELPLKCPVICHFGRKDSYIPADEAKAKIEAAHQGLPVYIYENSGHGFNNDGRPDSDLEDAKLARKRTLELFERALPA